MDMLFRIVFVLSPWILVLGYYLAKKDSRKRVKKEEQMEFDFMKTL